MTTFVRERRPGSGRRPGRAAAGRGFVARGVVAVALLALASCTSTTTPNPETGATAGGGETAATGNTAATGTGLIPPDPDGDTGGAATDGTSAPATASGPPGAALLTWLDGASPQHGIVTGSAGQTWVGRAAGEYATLGDGWYRYFGPDGSLVGCTSAGACVGVGADSTVAVTRVPGGPRDVYRSDGRFLGRYGPDGDKVAGTGAAADFADALTGTGVDLIGLLDAAGRGAPFAGGLTGDPHVITAGGQRFSTQTAGQYEARIGDPGHRIQAQFSPMSHRTDVSVTSAVAIGTEHDVVLFDANGAVTINGDRQPAAQDFTQIELSAGAVAGVWPADATTAATMALVWPDGGMVTAIANGALGLTVVAHLHPVAGAAGLFGTSAVSNGRDLTARGGGTAGSVDSAVRSWRVRPDDRLLPPSSAAKSGAGTASVDIDPSARKVAARLCDVAGLNQAPDAAACTFDVAVTGDTGFIPGHVALATAARSTDVPSGFAERWPALEVGSVAAATDLLASGRIDASVAPGRSQLYRVTTRSAGPVRLVSDDACATGTVAALDQPAWRLFDEAGRPVSDRFPLCGNAATAAVPAGDYVLTVANGIGAPALQVAARVTAP